MVAIWVNKIFFFAELQESLLQVCWKWSFWKIQDGGRYPMTAAIATVFN